MKPKVTGIGGIFYKARDPGALGVWYRDHLGFDVEAWGGTAFRSRDEAGKALYTIWNAFAHDTKYFDPSAKDFMLNLRVDDLDAMLTALRSKGAQVLARREESEYGKFGYVLDPEGTLLELWEPPAVDPVATSTSG